MQFHGNLDEHATEQGVRMEKLESLKAAMRALLDKY